MGEDMEWYGFTCVGCGRQEYYIRDKKEEGANRQVCAGCEGKRGEEQGKRGAEKESKAECRARSREPADIFKMVEDEKDGK